MLCKACNEKIPSRIKVDGEVRQLSHRKYCLACSPYGSHNTHDPRNRGVKRDNRSRSFICAECGSPTTQRTRNLVCNGCRANKRRAASKRRSVDYLGGSCKLCGYSACLRALCFHHRNPKEKSFSLSFRWNKPWRELVLELDKCDLLCVRCHVELHDKLDGPMGGGD